MSERLVSPGTLPAFGDVRSLGRGDVVWVSRTMPGRDDWSRYVEAIAAAVSKGAEVRWLTR